MVFCTCMSACTCVLEHMHTCTLEVREPHVWGICMSACTCALEYMHTLEVRELHVWHDGRLEM